MLGLIDGMGCWDWLLGRNEGVVGSAGSERCAGRRRGELSHVRLGVDWWPAKGDCRSVAGGKLVALWCGVDVLGRCPDRVRSPDPPHAAWFIPANGYGCGRSLVQVGMTGADMGVRGSVSGEEVNAGRPRAGVWRSSARQLLAARVKGGA